VQDHLDAVRAEIAGRGLAKRTNRIYAKMAWAGVLRGLIRSRGRQEHLSQSRIDHLALKGRLIYSRKRAERRGAFGDSSPRTRNRVCLGDFQPARIPCP
jgi:hypothetical protein